MGNCYPFIKKKQKGNKEICLAILGIDNAGKTTTTKTLKGESVDMVAPTIGFDRVEFSIGRWNITMYDVGGGKNIRDIWYNYFPEVHGLVYVVDSSDIDRMNEAKEVLTSVTHHEKISGKPILLLANKQDCESALDEGELLYELNVEELMNKTKTPCKLERCSATIGLGNKLDKSIQRGLHWLLSYVDIHWDELSQRVQQDTSKAADKAAEEREARRARVRKIREEREQQELKNGIKEEDVIDDVPTDDPFKPLNLKTLQEKKSDKTSKTVKDIAQNLSMESNFASDTEHPTDGKLDRSEQKYSDKVFEVTEIDESSNKKIVSNYNQSQSIGRETLTPLQPPNESSNPDKSTDILSNGKQLPKYGSILAPLTNDDSDIVIKKKKNKRRGFRKNKLSPEVQSDAGSVMPRATSIPDLFMTQKNNSKDID